MLYEVITLFLPYLEEISTLKYYGKANIGSRPSKRGGDGKINFDDLRAIPFVGAWSQLKQNVPGFFGLGTALKDHVITSYSIHYTKLYDNYLP